MGSQPDYSQPPLRVSFAGFLWDMDGTIIDSTPAIVKHWHSYAFSPSTKSFGRSLTARRNGKEIGVDGDIILKTSHGRRSIDILRDLAPEKANWESWSENAAPWAIVTSGTEPLVHGWLSRLNLAIPANLVTAESVLHGKPDPTCYRMGLEKLNLTDVAGDVLVLEDSPAGIKAGKDAGCKVIGLVTSHTVEQVAAAKPDWVVKDLTSVTVVATEGSMVVVEITDALRL
ncbi:hypothetical protein NQ176_g2887 [Zarea fungicola]|uniref:Uncharacterized protein n=1 Tax=Zarea fungicola TaxID=93591 RepID=A0ACC1NLT4_9HYPO|nr:hypothetical protein NQ176_g2887 [Lecanicillium fungicola]